MTLALRLFARHKAFNSASLSARLGNAAYSTYVTWLCCKKELPTRIKMPKGKLKEYM
jgi:hypothetical protein